MSEAALAEPARCEADHRLVERFGRFGDLCVVEIEKHERRTDGRALVAVDEGLVFGDMERARTGSTMMRGFRIGVLTKLQRVH